MNIETILLFIGILFSGVIALVIGYYLTKFVRQIPAFPEPKTLPEIIKPKSSKLRQTSCLAISRNAIRHTDGSYTAGFLVDVPPILLTEQNRVDELYRGLQRLLTSEKAAGTVIQLRWANHLENGHLLLNETRPDSISNIYLPARIMHEESLNYIWKQMVQFGFRSAKLSAWVKVPIKDSNDNLNNGFSLVLKQVKDSFSWSNISGTMSIFFNGIKNDGITRRIISDEENCQNQAEKVFQQFQREFPLKTKRLGDKNLWEALYLGHNEKERLIPSFPNTEDTRFVDLRAFLCQDDIRFGDNYVLHGDTPAAIVSMTLPPSVSYNGILSSVTQNPALRFRYTLNVEYIHYGKTKALKTINSSIFWNSKNPFKTPESKRAGESLYQVRDDLASPNSMLAGVRVFAVIYANPVTNQAQLIEQLKQLENFSEKVISEFKRLSGANAIREDGDVLRQLYGKTLIAEFDQKPTGLEIDEMTPQLATFGTLQGAWRGFKRPHTILENASGELFGLNLLQSKDNTATTAVCIGTTRSGKSVLVGKCVKDILGSVEHASCVAMDFGETYGPLVEVLGGRQIRFVPEEEKSLNIWSYDNIEKGVEPSEPQIALVIGDLLLNAGIKPENPDYSLYSSICDEVVRVVYQNNVAQNGEGLDRKEPVHSDFLDTLENFPFEGLMVDLAKRLHQLLKRYRGHKWLDAPTHPDFLKVDEESRFDVYELDSLEQFQPEIQASLAYRVAARIITSAGKKIDGKFYPKIQVFDEMHKVKDKYPQILDAIQRGARMGGKANVLTILATQAYEDLEGLHGITANAGIFLIGKQGGNFDKLAEHANLSPQAIQAVKSITNVVGSHTQFVFAFGNGLDQKSEVAIVSLSSMEYWSLTSNPDERNARTTAALLLPHEPLINVIAQLAEVYPRGLVSINKTQLDDEFVNNLYHQARLNGYFEDEILDPEDSEEESLELKNELVEEYSN
ncbi:MAG TPA: hypothetical protein PKY82_02345 [Pyrinomonadaceae bacterium]|nr:hypothetical protein [Pyrinomonadaceae bacterium]